MVLITGFLVQSGYDILPLEFAQLPLDVRDDTDYLRGLAWQERHEGDDIIDRNAVADANQSERTVLGERVELFFEKPGGNVFTRENLQAMKEVEDDFFTNMEYQRSYCQLVKETNPKVTANCLKPSSVLRYFDGTYAWAGDIFKDNPTFDNVTSVLHAAETNNLTKKALQSFLGKDAVLDGTVAVSEITYTVLYVGLPLDGYDNATHEEEKQLKKIEEFLVDEFQDRCKENFEDGVENIDGEKMDFFYFSEQLFVAEITQQSVMDMMLATGSLCFIIIFMLIQTQSFWITMWFVFSILCGFFTTNLIYRVVLDFRYLGIFHVLSIFIILGVGADDVFILYDTWRESSHSSYPSLAHRLSFVYRRAAFAMLFTSLTTGIAFIVSAFSPFLGVSTFGVFAGILVFVNYLSVIIFLPTVVVTYHLYWDKYTCCCCCERYRTHDVTLQPPTSAQKNFVVRFFAGPYFRLLTHKVIRWVLLVMFLGVVAFFTYQATKLEVNEDQVGCLESIASWCLLLNLLVYIAPTEAGKKSGMHCKP